MFPFKETLEVLQAMFVVCAFILFSYALPSYFIQRSLRRHYREWIVDSKAYWHRFSDKWVIGNRVFYTDELTYDILVSLLYGIVLGNIGARILFSFLEIDQKFVFIVGTAIATALLLFAFTQLERVRLIDAALEVKKITDPQFENESEITELLIRDHAWVRKIIGRQSKITG